MKLNENGLGLTETCNMQAYSYECMRHICSVNQCLPLSYYTRLSIPLSGINNRKSNSLTTSYTEREKLIRPTRYDLQSIPHSHRDTNYGSHIRSNRTNKKISTFYNQQIASSLYTILEVSRSVHSRSTNPYHWHNRKSTNQHKKIQSKSRSRFIVTT